jgi:transposase
LQKKIQTYKAAGKSIIYIDESGFAKDMPRTHGYASKGQACFGVSDWQAKGRTNAIGALLGAGLLTVMLFTCNIDSDVFHSWAVTDLLPKLPFSSIIVMDNAAFHKRQDTQDAIRSAGHELEYLPPYSPDLNPIEHKWAQAKKLRRAKFCEVDKLFSGPIL